MKFRVPRIEIEIPSGERQSSFQPFSQRTSQNLLKTPSPTKFTDKKGKDAIFDYKKIACHGTSDPKPMDYLSLQR